jgi:NPCBM-associated, NEW3 domain of alpha-galactosidase
MPGPWFGFLLAVLLVAAPALAQQPPSSAKAEVDITGETEAGTVSVDHPASFSFTIKNNSPTVPGGEQQSKGDVTVAVDGVPAGWTVAVQPSAFELAPGATMAVTVQVQVAPDAEAEAASMTVKVVLVSALEGLDPILGQIPGGTASQTATDSAPLAIEVHNSATRQVMETLGPWIYVLLLLLVAAVVVAIALTVAARRTLVRMAADVREQPVAPGGRVSFPFRVEGLARDTDTVLLQVSATQEGWAAFLPVPELVIEPGQPQDLTLVVIAPRTAAQGARQAVLVTATSARAPKGAANLEFVAVVEGPEDLATAPRRLKAA